MECLRINELKQAISTVTGIPVDGISVEILDVDNEYRGTYAYSLLVHYITEWVNKLCNKKMCINVFIYFLLVSSLRLMVL